MFKFHQNRLSGFRDVGGRNLPFPHYYGRWLIQQLGSLHYSTGRDLTFKQRQRGVAGPHKLCREIRN